MLLKQEVFKNLEAMWRDEDSGEDHTVSSYLMIGLVGCYSPGSGCMFQFQTAGLDVRPQLNFEFPTPGLPVRGQRRIDVLQAQVDANSWSLWHLVVSTYMYIVISYIYIYINGGPQSLGEYLLILHLARVTSRKFPQHLFVCWKNGATFYHGYLYINKLASSPNLELLSSASSPGKFEICRASSASSPGSDRDW